MDIPFFPLIQIIITKGEMERKRVFIIRENQRGQRKIKYIRAEEIISRQFQLNGLYICKRLHSLLMVARKEAIKQRKMPLLVFYFSLYEYLCELQVLPNVWISQLKHQIIKTTSNHNIQLGSLQTYQISFRTIYILGTNEIYDGIQNNLNREFVF